MSEREAAELVGMIRRALGLVHGDQLVVRERHLWPCTIHRGRHEWTVLLDQADDRRAFPHAMLGWEFRDAQDLADFLYGTLKQHHLFALEGMHL